MDILDSALTMEELESGVFSPATLSPKEDSGQSSFDKESCSPVDMEETFSIPEAELSDDVGLSVLPSKDFTDLTADKSCAPSGTETQELVRSGTFSSGVSADWTPPSSTLTSGSPPGSPGLPVDLVRETSSPEIPVQLSTASLRQREGFIRSRAQSPDEVLEMPENLNDRELVECRRFSDEPEPIQVKISELPALEITGIAVEDSVNGLEEPVIERTVLQQAPRHVFHYDPESFMKPKKSPVKNRHGRVVSPTNPDKMLADDDLHKLLQRIPEAVLPVFSADAEESDFLTTTERDGTEPIPESFRTEHQSSSETARFLDVVEFGHAESPRSRSPLEAGIVTDVVEPLSDAGSELSNSPPDARRDHNVAEHVAHADSIGNCPLPENDTTLVEVTEPVFSSTSVDLNVDTWEVNELDTSSGCGPTFLKALLHHHPLGPFHHERDFDFAILSNMLLESSSASATLGVEPCEPLGNVPDLDDNSEEGSHDTGDVLDGSCKYKKAVLVRTPQQQFQFWAKEQETNSNVPSHLPDDVVPSNVVNVADPIKKRDLMSECISRIWPGPLGTNPLMGNLFRQGPGRHPVASVLPSTSGVAPATNPRTTSSEVPCTSTLRVELSSAIRNACSFFNEPCPLSMDMLDEVRRSRPKPHRTERKTAPPGEISDRNHATRQATKRASIPVNSTQQSQVSKNVQDQGVHVPKTGKKASDVGVIRHTASIIQTPRKGASAKKSSLGVPDSSANSDDAPSVSKTSQKNGASNGSQWLTMNVKTFPEILPMPAGCNRKKPDARIPRAIVPKEPMPKIALVPTLKDSPTIREPLKNGQIVLSGSEIPSSVPVVVQIKRKLEDPSPTLVGRPGTKRSRLTTAASSSAEPHYVSLIKHPLVVASSTFVDPGPAQTLQPIPETTPTKPAAKSHQKDHSVKTKELQPKKFDTPMRAEDLRGKKKAPEFLVPEKPKRKKKVQVKLKKEPGVTDIKAYLSRAKLDLTRPQSVVGHAVFDKVDFRGYFDKLPQFYQHEIMGKMPDFYKETGPDGRIRLKDGILGQKDTAFKRHLNQFQENLRNGEYDSDVRRMYIDMVVAKVDPWKVDNFEPMYGDIMNNIVSPKNIQPVAQPAADAAPVHEPLTQEERIDVS